MDDVVLLPPVWYSLTTLEAPLFSTFVERWHKETYFSILHFGRWLSPWKMSLTNFISPLHVTFSSLHWYVFSWLLWVWRHTWTLNEEAFWRSLSLTRMLLFISLGSVTLLCPVKISRTSTLMWGTCLNSLTLDFMNGHGIALV